MSVIRINLLPDEIKAERSKSSKSSLVSRLSILIIIVIVLVTFAVITISAISTVNLNQKKAKLKEAMDNVSLLNETEGLVVILKDRIKDINGILSSEALDGEMFLAVSDKLPPLVRLNTFTSDIKGTVNLTGETTDTQSLDDFLNSLLGVEVGLKKVEGGTFNSIAQNTNGVIKFDLSLKLSK
jgi:Tfp pilus assembly protein PilN